MQNMCVCLSKVKEPHCFATRLEYEMLLREHDFQWPKDVILSPRCNNETINEYIWFPCNLNSM